MDRVSYIFSTAFMVFKSLVTTADITEVVTVVAGGGGDGGGGGGGEGWWHLHAAKDVIFSTRRHTRQVWNAKGGDKKKADDQSVIFIYLNLTGLGRSSAIPVTSKVR